MYVMLRLFMKSCDNSILQKTNVIMCVTKMKLNTQTRGKNAMRKRSNYFLNNKIQT